MLPTIRNYFKRRLLRKIMRAVVRLNEARAAGDWPKIEAAHDKLHALYVRHPQIVEHYI